MESDRELIVAEITPEAEPVVEVIAPPPAPLPPDVGDDVWLVFWRAFKMPDQSDRGSWDILPAVVISVGRKICVEVSPNTPTSVGNADGRESFGLLRFPAATDLYPDRKAAEEAAKSRPRPLT